MKITKQRLKEIIKEEILTERLKRFKVYVSGESQPLILMGKNEKEVKQTAHMMIKNSSIKIKKVVREGKLNEEKYVVASVYGDLYTPKAVPEKQALKLMSKLAKQYAGDNVFMLGVKAWNKPHKYNKKKIKVKESWDSPQGWSSKEAKNVIDGALKDYAKDLRKVQGRVVKDWMSKAKAGVIDYFDIVRGLQTGDVTRAHPYEVEFLNKVLNKDKIIQRFRQYFDGKKGKKSRRK
jgi:hypothetical protein